MIASFYVDWYLLRLRWPLTQNAIQLAYTCQKIPTDFFPNLIPTVKWDQESFKDNDEKVLLFTGLPNWQILMILFGLLSPFLPEKNSMNKFKTMMLTFMRLRINLSNRF